MLSWKQKPEVSVHFWKISTENMARLVWDGVCMFSGEKIEDPFQGKKEFAGLFWKPFAVPDIATRGQAITSLPISQDEARFPIGKSECVKWEAEASKAANACREGLFSRPSWPVQLPVGLSVPLALPSPTCHSCTLCREDAFCCKQACP